MQSQVLESGALPASFRAAKREEKAYSGHHLPRHRRIESERLALTRPFWPVQGLQRSEMSGPHIDAAFF